MVFFVQDNIKPEHRHSGEMVTMTAQDQHSLSDSSLMKLSTEVQNDITGMRNYFNKWPVFSLLKSKH